MKYFYSLIFTTLFIFIYSIQSKAQSREIITIAGMGVGGFSGDGYSAQAAMLNGPNDVAVDLAGNVYIEDFYNFRIRKVLRYGSIVTFAGNGLNGNTGDGGIATNAEFRPNGVATDKHGNVYISDYAFSQIRKVNTLGIIATFAGGGIAGYSGDNYPATSALLSHPQGMTMDKKMNLYFADVCNHVIRKIDSTGIITTIAGNHIRAWGGDLGLAINASLDSPYSVAKDKWNTIYIADYGNNIVRKIDTFGVITTLAGTGFYGYTGDNGPAALATFNKPTGVAVDTAGNVYIADSRNNVIRMIDTLGKITTIVGNSWAGFSGDNGLAIGANLNNPQTIAIDTFGSIFIADANNERVRKVYWSTEGVSKVAATAQINAYPNPFNNKITIEGINNEDVISISDITGRNINVDIISKFQNKQVLTINNLISGMYFIQVTSKDGLLKATLKITK